MYILQSVFEKILHPNIHPMKKPVLFCLLFSLLLHFAFAQNGLAPSRKTSGYQKGNLTGTLQNTENIAINRCGTMDKLAKDIEKDPSLKLKMEDIEKNMQEWMKNHQSEKTSSVITIPVVVHVVYYSTSQNISDAQIQSQMDVLNADYRKLNSDFSTAVPSAFQSLAGDAQIEFCLASEDPNGNATTGIVRVKTTKTSFSDNDDVKYTSKGGDDAWDSKSYLNLWVCNLTGGLLGYSTFPGGNSALDGCVIGYKYFGTTGTVSSPYNLGRTVTHEVGHWLLLYHIWGDDGGSCTGSDLVSDTPNQASENYTTPSYPKTDNCTKTSPGIMYMNFMDYTPDKGMGMFSAGQATRMLSAINTYRSGLKTSQGCSGTTTTTLTADFSANSTTIYEGGSVTFTDQSSGNPTSWLWTLTGASSTSSTSQNPTVTYNTAGTYSVTLKVGDGNTYDTETKTSYITVLQAQTNGGCDTVTNIGGNSSTVLYSIQGGGYLSGHNSYGDLAKADYFSVFPSNSELTSALLAFGVAKYSSTNKTISVKAWDNTGSNGSPGNTLATQTVKISTIATDVANNAYSLVTFTNPITISTPFYLGIEFAYSSGDTVGLYTNDDGETPVGTAWDKWSDKTWHAFSDADNWNMNMSHYILPIFCSQTTTALHEESTLISNVLLYPNPSTGRINLNINLKAPSKLEITILNTLGEVVKTLSVGNTSGGNYEFDLSNYTNGIYFVKVNTNQDCFMQRLVLSAN